MNAVGICSGRVTQHEPGVAATQSSSYAVAASSSGVSSAVSCGQVMSNGCAFTLND